MWKYLSCLTPFLAFSRDIGPLFSRRAIWAGKYFVNAKTDGDRLELSRRDLDALLEQLAAVALPLQRQPGLVQDFRMMG